jgi:thiol:disulfide interchange protein DsbD
MVWVRRLMGWVLVGMAFHFVRPIFPPDMGLYLLAAVALIAGVDLGWRTKIAGGSRGFALLRFGVGVIGVVLALTLAGGRIVRGPGMPWHEYTDELLAAAHREGKPVIIDFSAAWCTPCRRLEEETFHNKQVVELATAQFAVVKVDLTSSGNPLYERLLREYAIKGVPTIVFLRTDGRELPALRLVDYLPAEGFLTLMRAAQVNRQP